MLTKEKLVQMLDYDAIINSFGSSGGNSYVYDIMFMGHEPGFYWAEGSWEGKVTVIYNIKGHHILIEDEYGSCDSCDAWDNVNDEELYDCCVALVNNCALIYETLEELCEDIVDESFEYRHPDFKKEFYEYCKNSSDKKK